MKLLSKNNRYYFSTALLILTVGGVLFYFVLRFMLNQNINELLVQEKQKVIDYVEDNHALPKEDFQVGDELKFRKTIPPSRTFFRDTIIYIASEQEEAPFREIVFPVKLNNVGYTAIITTALYETEDLIISIIGAMFGLLALLLAALFFANRIISRKLWQPFYEALDKVKAFSIVQSSPLSLPQTTTDEFQQLNASLLQLTSKMQGDYLLMKEFTANASHELQTPIAIIRSKVELLMQMENGNEEQRKNIQDVFESVNRLSKLNQSLLMLAKIENGQFDEMETVDLHLLFEDKMQELTEWIQHRHIRITFHHHSMKTITANPQLADILVTNLLTNAIRHNHAEGNIDIVTEENTLMLRNTGDRPSFDTTKIFERFSKNDAASGSSGLGLAIVKQICDLYQWQVHYHYSGGWHDLKITF